MCIALCRTLPRKTPHAANIGWRGRTWSERTVSSHVIQQAAAATAQDSADKRYFGIDVPFMAHIGLVPDMEEGLCRTRLDVAPHLVNSRGDVRA